VDEVDLLSLELPRRRLDGLRIALCVPDVQNVVFALFEPQLPEPLPQFVDHHLIHTAVVDDPHAIDVPGRLPAGGVWRDERAQGEDDQSNEPWATALSPQVRIHT
jgi:hypothetical protein